MRQRDFIRVWSPETPRERVRRFAALIARDYGVTADEVLGESRERAPSRARFALYALLRADGMSLPQIGRILGRDHSTIHYGIAVHHGETPKGRRRAA